jgi:hypothetical protein
LNILNIQVILAILWTVAAALAIAAVCILLFTLIKRFISVKRECVHTILLKNQGNVTSVYQLSVESPEPKLHFKFLFRNIPLAEVLLAVPVNEHQPEQTASKATGGNHKNGAAVVNKAQKSGKAVARKSGEAASFLAALGNLLPGQAGKALKKQGAAVRDVQTKTSQTMRVQDQAERQVSAVQRGSSRLGVKTSIPSQGAGGPHSKRIINQADVPLMSYIQVAQTAPVEPGQSIPLSLKISSPGKRISEGSFLYTLTSQQVPLEKLERDAAPITSRGTVHFGAVSVWRYALPVFLYIFVIAGCSLALAFVLTLIWA